jgi:hypothetical protein
VDERLCRLLQDSVPLERRPERSGELRPDDEDRSRWHEPVSQGREMTYAITPACRRPTARRTAPTTSARRMPSSPYSLLPASPGPRARRTSAGSSMQRAGLEIRGGCEQGRRDLGKRRGVEAAMGRHARELRVCERLAAS